MAINIALFSSLKWAISQLYQAGKEGLILLYSLNFLQGLFPLFYLLILKALVGAFNEGQLPSSVAWICLSWIGLVLFENVLSPITQMMNTRINERIHTHFSLLLMKKANSIFGLDLFENPAFQNEVSLLREETSYKHLNFMILLTSSFKEMITITTILILLGSLSLWLPFVLFISTLPQVIFAFYAEKKAWDYSLFHNEDIRKITHFCSLSLEQASAKEIRIYDFGHFLMEKFSSLAKTAHKKMASQRKQQYLSSIPYMLCKMTGHFILLIWIAWHLKNSSLSLANTILTIQSLHQFQTESLGFIHNMGWLSSIISYFQTFKNFIHRPESFPTPNKHPLRLPIRSIEFQNVSFGYEDRQFILKKLSFSIKAGEKIAIVGANGAGKSTLIKLLCRFYDPIQGTIFINGTDLKEIDIEEWRKELSVIFQDFGKYPLTLEENITIAHVMKSKDKTRIKEALKKSGLGYLEQNFQDGLETILGKEYSGKELSFGEWQKLAISRLFFRDAPIIIMDEPTASLDPNSEYEIFQRLTEAFEDKTVILITHRLNSIRMCDKILLLKNGQILEQGSHQELLQQKGEYSELFALQAAGYQAAENAFHHPTP